MNGTDGYMGSVIAGQAGVGKSRLAQEALQRAAVKGLATRWAVGTASARTVPLGALAAWSDGTGSNPLELVQQLTESLSDAVHEAVVAVDDAHLLDELSAFVLHHLVLRETAKVIITIRTGEPAPDAITSLWKDGHLQRVDLQPLSRTESDQLMAAALGGPLDDKSAMRMWHLTRGNSLYIRHVVDQEVGSGRLREDSGSWHWLDTPIVSDSVADLLERQIGALRGPVRTVVDTVAVAEPLPTEVLSQLSDGRAIEEAEAHGLIGIDTTGPRPAARIAHPLYGEVRRARAGPIRLRRLRGRVATALDSLPETGIEDVVRRVVLRADSDLPVDAEMFLRGAKGAMSLLDLYLGERLARLSARAGGGIEAEIVSAHALILLNRNSDAEAILADAPVATLSESQRARLLTLRAANLLWGLARPTESETVINNAMLGASPGLVPSLQAVRTIQLAVAGRPTEAVELGASIDLGRVPDLPAMCAIWAKVIAAGDIGELGAASLAAESGYRLAASSLEASYQGVGLAEFHVTALVLAGQVMEAEAVADRTYRQCMNLPGVTCSMGAAIAGIAALGRGQLTVAIERLTQAFSDFEALGYPFLVYRFGIVLAQAHAVVGQVAAAKEALLAVDEHRHPAFEFVESEHILAEAWTCAAAGAIPRAASLARRAAAHAASHNQHSREVLCLQVATHLGDQTCSVRLAELAMIMEGGRARVAAAFASAIASHDAPELSVVSTEFEDLGDSMAAADAAAQAALAFRRSGRKGSSLTLSLRAQRLARECGGASTPALQEIAEQRLPLTRRERQVVSLVAQGHSNRQIADILTMSVRTVEGHLYRAQAKTGTCNRHELGALLREQ